jgi:hypothetical protein
MQEVGTIKATVAAWMNYYYRSQNGTALLLFS